MSINKTTNKYTLKNLEKKVSTLKSLAPRKNKGKKKKGDKEKNKEEKEKKRKKKKKDKKIKDKNTSLPQTENK